MYYVPDSALYARQRVDELKSGPLGRITQATTQASKSVLQSVRENIIDDYTVRDLFTRSIASIHPLLAAMVPEQQQLRDALSKLKGAVSIQNEYMEQQLDIQNEQTNILEEIKNLNRIATDKLDTLEAIAEGREKPVRVEHEERVKLETGRYAPVKTISKKITHDEPDIQTASPIVTNEESTVSTYNDIFEKQLHELELMRANIESLNSYLTGSEQFGFSGVIDRIFNKYTAFLNRHPAFRAIHALSTGFIKLKMGITKPGKIKGVIASSIKRFLGVGEEGPLQQLVSISAGQLNIQHKIYQMIKDHFKKGNEYELDESTLSLFSKNVDEKIDEKIDNFVNKIPFIQKVSEVKEKVTNRIQVPTGLQLTLGGLSSVPKPVQPQVQPPVEVEPKNITPKSITPAIQNTKEIIQKKKLSDLKITNLKQTLKEFKDINKTTDKFIVKLDKLEKKTEDILGEKIFSKFEKTITDKVPIKLPENIAEKRKFLGEKASTTAGETAIGLTSLLFPVAPVVTQLAVGNYKLAARESLYLVPILGQLLTLRNLIKLYKENKDQINIKTAKEQIAKAKESVKNLNKNLKIPQLPKPNIETTKQLIKQYTPKKEGVSQKVKNIQQKLPEIDRKVAMPKLPFAATVGAPFTVRSDNEQKTERAVKNVKVTPMKEETKSAYARFKQTLAGDIITRIPIVKMIEGAIERKLSKVLWGAFGTFFTPLYAGIEGIKFLTSRFVKHPMKLFNFGVRATGALAKGALKVPEVAFRSATTVAQKAITAPIRTAQFAAKVTGFKRAEKFLKTIADGIVLLRKDIVNALPRALYKLWSKGIDKIVKFLKDFTLLKMLWQGLKLGTQKTLDFISSVPNFFRFRKKGGKVPKVNIPKINTPTKVPAKSIMGGIKGLGKTALKKVPMLGLLAGGAFGIKKLMQGDVTGGLLEVASGAASMIPGFGTAISAAIDMYNANREVNKEVKPAIQTANTDQMLYEQKKHEITKATANQPPKTYDKVVGAIKETNDTIMKSAQVVSSNVANTVSNTYNNIIQQSNNNDLEAYRLQPVFIKP